MSYNGVASVCTVFVTFALRRRARTMTEWVVILEMLGKKSNDKEPSKRSQGVLGGWDYVELTLDVVLADVRQVGPSSRLVRRYRRLLSVQHHFL